MLLTILQDFCHDLRVLSRNPGLLLAAVRALTLGLSTNTAILSAMNGMLLPPAGCPPPQRIVQSLSQLSNSNRHFANLSQRAVRTAFKGVSYEVAAPNALRTGPNFAFGRFHGPIQGKKFSADLLHLFGAQVALERIFTEAECGDRHLSIDQQPVGWSIALGDRPHISVGVVSFLPRKQQVSDSHFGLFLQIYRDPLLDNRWRDPCREAGL